MNNKKKVMVVKFESKLNDNNDDENILIISGEGSGVRICVDIGKALMMRSNKYDTKNTEEMMMMEDGEEEEENWAGDASVWKAFVASSSSFSTAALADEDDEPNWAGGSSVWSGSASYEEDDVKYYLGKDTITITTSVSSSSFCHHHDNEETMKCDGYLYMGKGGGEIQINSLEDPSSSSLLRFHLKIAGAV